jgi:hypothetical protein
MKSHYLAICILFICLAACGGSPPPVTPTSVPTISPSPTAVPTIFPTPTVAIPSSPLFQSVTLDYWSYNNGVKNARVPALTGSLDPRVLKFNHEMSALVDEVIRLAASDWGGKHAPVDPNLPGSTLDVRFELLSPPGSIFSLKFEITSYAKGAAHPFDYTRTVTYDLEKGEDVTLDQLFLPGVDFLGLISTYCLAQLSASEVGSVLSVEGAQPTVENYRNWNVTADGLLITFDEYQVAPYAAGPQTVTVPYSELQAILSPQGPLAGVLSK